MDLEGRPRSKAMFAAVKPNKGRKLDAILLKISETSKSDIGDEKHGISPENPSVQMLGQSEDVDHLESADYEELSPGDGGDGSKRRRTTRKGDVRRVMRSCDISASHLEDPVLETEAHSKKTNGKIQEERNGVNNIAAVSPVKVNGHRSSSVEEEGDDQDDDSVQNARGSGSEPATPGGINTIGERLSLLDAYLYHEGSDEEGARPGGRARDTRDSDDYAASGDEDDVMANDAVTVVPVEPQALGVTEDNKLVKADKGKVHSQPPTCNICGKSFSCISNVYRHKRKVHRKKGGKSSSAPALTAVPIGNHVSKSLDSATTGEKKVEKPSTQLTSHQPSHNLGREINCELCGKTLTKSNIARHRRLVHFNPNRRQPAKLPTREEKKDVKPASIPRDSNFGKSRKEFKENAQGDAPTSQKVTTQVVGKKVKFSCDICHQVFSCRSNVYRHKRLVHKRSTKDGTQVGKITVIGGLNKVADRGIKRDSEGEGKRDFKRERVGREKQNTEVGNAELSLPLDTPANSMVSLPSYRRSKYVCSICGLVFMARSTYYRHKKTHRTATENDAKANSNTSNEGVGRETSSTAVVKGTSEKLSDVAKESKFEEKKVTIEEIPADSSRSAVVSGVNLTIITSGRGKSKFACGICGQVFPCRSNAYHHRRLAHGKVGHSNREDKENITTEENTETPGSDNLRWSRRPGSCDICGKIFSCKGNIYRHKRLVHGVDSGGRAMFQGNSQKEEEEAALAPSSPESECSEKDEGGKYLCDICGNGFSCGGNVQRHKRNVHGMTPTREAYMPTSRAKQILAKAKSYSTRRAAALGHAHELRSTSLPLRSSGHLAKKQIVEKRKIISCKTGEVQKDRTITVKLHPVRSQTLPSQTIQADQNPQGTRSFSDVAGKKDIAREKNKLPAKESEKCVEQRQRRESSTGDKTDKINTDEKKSPVAAVAEGKIKFSECTKIFVSEGDPSKDTKERKVAAEIKTATEVANSSPKTQQSGYHKQCQSGETRYPGHHLSPVAPYYAYHGYGNQSAYRSCIGYCDGTCRHSGIEPTATRDRESQSVYYSSHGYYGQSSFKHGFHRGDQIYAFGGPHVEDYQQREIGALQEPYFHDGYDRIYRYGSKNGHSAESRFCEPTSPYGAGRSEDYPSKDQEVVQDIINANLVEESEVTDLYACLSCSNCFETRNDLDKHTEQHASEPLADFQDYPSGQECTPFSATRQHFHYPQPPFCSSGAELYGTSLNHRVSRVDQHAPCHVPAPASHRGTTVITGRLDLAPSSYYVGSPTACRTVKYKGVGTQANLDPDDGTAVVVTCCYCSSKYASKTDLWSHLMRRHGMKSRDARAKAHDCAKRNRKTVEVEGGAPVVNKEGNINKRSEDDALKIADSATMRSIADHTTKEIQCAFEETALPKEELGYENLAAALARASETNPAFDAPTPADSLCRKEMKEVEGHSMAGEDVMPVEQENKLSGEGEVVDNQNSCDQEGSLFRSVCENVMALINSPDPSRQLDNDFDLGDCEEDLLKTTLIQCKDCPLTFNTPKKFRLHVRLHHGELPYECKVCFQRFRNGMVLKQHRVLHANLGEQVLYCKICDKDFNKLTNYETHVACHEDKVAAACDNCGRSFLSHRSLGQHRRLQVCFLGSGEAACKTCGLKFRTRLNLRRHIIKKHLHRRHLFCSLCSKHFTDLRALKSHTWIHMSSRQRSCDQCHKTFPSRADLRDHISVHHECACNICHKSLENLEILERHKIFIHSKRETEDERGKLKRNYIATSAVRSRKLSVRFKCNVCMKLFSSRKRLKKHRMSHNGILRSSSMMTVI